MKRYDELMEKIEVTDEMRTRILHHVDRELSVAEHTSGSAPLLKVRRRMKRYLSAAACLAVVLIGALALPQLMRPEENIQQGVNGMVEVASTQALAQSVGFPVEDLSCLPFSVEAATYTDCWGTMAEITYNGDGQEAMYRKSRGTEDNSGDFNTYEQTTTLTAASAEVTLKGDADGYTLAVWNCDGYSYSLSLSVPQSAEQWENMVREIS